MGTLIAGHYVESNWGYSFITLAYVMIGLSVIIFLFLLPEPSQPHTNGRVSKIHFITSMVLVLIPYFLLKAERKNHKKINRLQTKKFICGKSIKKYIFKVDHLYSLINYFEVHYLRISGRQYSRNRRSFGDHWFGRCK